MDVFRYCPIHVADGTRLFHRDWGDGAPVFFLASWSQPSDAWTPVMQALADTNHRCVAYDRRGHGRSDDPGRGYDFNTLADDLAAVLEALDLRETILVGHSMAAGEIVRCLTHHGASRMAGMAFISPTTPIRARSSDNPDGLEPALIDATQAALARDLPAWRDANLDGFVTPETSLARREWLRSLTLGCSLRAAVALNHAVVGADSRAEMRAIRCPALVVHGDADVSAPLELCGRATAALIRDAQLRVYNGAPHGLPITHATRLVTDLATFAREVRASVDWL